MWLGRWASGEGSGRPCRPPGQASAAHATSGKSARILGRAEPRLADPHISRASWWGKSRRKTRRSPSADRTQAIMPGPSGSRARISPVKGEGKRLSQAEAQLPAFQDQGQVIGQDHHHDNLPTRKDRLMKMIAGRPGGPDYRKRFAHHMSPRLAPASLRRCNRPRAASRRSGRR
jgi:hypothetical protein